MDGYGGGDIKTRRLGCLGSGWLAVMARDLFVLLLTDLSQSYNHFNLNKD
ncbi:hypothetical protein QBC37DRAFT_368431 [Rhypophila decipiens]|uniref:Uncharacterized protein n=1 Tax=Rhypophila decipiens TaxID=261697 RepID=A0AAN6YJR3_9PEZI|nr:hypothetical protein QBC37DRAFT_368431 [Rhypophila decipiens]